MTAKEHSCKHLAKFLKAQIEVMERHIQNHKYFQHIDNDNEAIADFIKKFGWLMREFYCGYSCPEREDCDYAEQFLKGERKKNGKKRTNS